MVPEPMFLTTSMQTGRDAWRGVVLAAWLSVAAPAFGQDEPLPVDQSGAVEQPGDVQQADPAQQASPTEQSVLVEPAGPAQQVGPAELRNPVEQVSPVDQSVPVGQAVPFEQPVPVDQAGQVAPPAQTIDSNAVYPPPAQPVPSDANGELTKKERKRLRKQQQQAMGVMTPAAPSMKDMFVSTVGAVVQASGGALLTGIAQVVTGRLVDWFSQKLGAAPANSYDPNSYGANSYGPSSYGPAVPVGQAAVPSPDPGMAPPYGASPAVPGAYPPATYPPATYPTAAYPDAAAAVPPAGIAAGLAFEVHRLDPSGATELVDPAFHEFHTGERFVVFFRPSLPGRMDIYNINPFGQQTLIDTQELAAGQLIRLGPYEFTAATGDEQLRMVMQPCSSPALMSATRDIVRVPDAVPVGAGIGLPACATMVTRSAGSVATRDIRKVTEEGGTSFALDQVSGDELASGQIAPREVTIRFRHL